jgi:tetratricopeptide (TPR) repeat protein
MIGKLACRACLLLVASLAVAGCGKLGNAIKCQSKDPDARIAGCTALIQTGEIQPENLAVIYANRGAAFSHKGEHDLAIRDFSEAIRLSANNPVARSDRGVEYYEEKDYDRAIQDFSDSIRLNPNYAPSHYERGNGYNARGDVYDNKSDHDDAIQDYNLAIEDYSDAIRLNSSYAFAYYGRGLAYDRRGLERDVSDDYDQAIQDYSEAIRLRPNESAVYDYRGLAYNHKGDYDKAIQDLNEAIRLNPKNTLSYLGRGAAYDHKGDFGRAIQDFNEVIRLNPKDRAAFDARGDTYLLQSNLAAAASDFTATISGGPSSRVAISAAIMLHVAMRRQGQDDSRQLAQVATAADLSKWPGPLLKFEMGKMTSGQLMAAATSPGDLRQKWHVCDTNYFTGEDALFRHQNAAALARLKAALDGCPKWDFGYVAAGVELKRLGVPDGTAK